MKKINLIFTILCILLLCGCNIHMHLFSSEVIPPTCISQGYTKYTCECGEVAKSEFVQPLGHDFADWIITQEPTNSSAGSKERTCKLCGELEIEEIPHTHTYIETIVEVTCTTNGYTEYVCLCGDNYKDNYVNALDHDYSDFVITREPTETSGGKKEKTCKRCNYKIVLDIPKLDHEHNYEIKNIELTCETDGCTLYTCYCGYSYQENIVKATGHNYTDWKIIKEATEYNSGLKEKTCVTCNNKVTEEIQRLDHEHKYTKNIVSPTCTSQGYTEYICLCNEKYTDTYTAPTGHNLEVEVLKKANYVEEGEIKKYCINCSHIEIEQTSAYNCNHEFNMSKQYSNSSLTPGLNITNCKYCCNQKMELVEAISPITQTTMPLKEYSQKSIKKSIIKAKNIFKEVENKNEKELFNIPYMSLKEFKEVREFTLNLIKDCTSDKQKTRVIYEWIIDNLVYDMNAYTYTVYDTFKTKKAVCFGYTSLLHDMLSAAGIMSSYVSGYTNYDNLKYTDIYQNVSNSNSHAWLYAYVDGEVLIMDPTWADGYNDKNYGFDMDINSMYKTHMVVKVEESIVIPDGVDYRLYSNLLYSFDQYTILIEQGIPEITDDNVPYQFKVTRNSSYSVTFVFNCNQSSIFNENDGFGCLVKNGFYCVSIMGKLKLDNWTYSVSNGLAYDVNTVVDYVNYLNNECGYNIDLDIPQDLQKLLS